MTSSLEALFSSCQVCTKQKFLQSNLDYPGSRLSGLFLWSQFGHEYLLVTITIRSHILFKTTALKSAIKCEGFLLSMSKSSARARRN